MLAIDLAHVGDEESVFLPGPAAIGVDAVDPMLQRLVDQGLSILHAITRLTVSDEQVSIEIDCCMFLGDVRDGRCCHNHAETAGAKIVEGWRQVVLGRLEDVRGKA